MSRVAEREEITRKQALEAFGKLCPGIVDNPFVPHWPLPQQALFLGSHQRPGLKKVYQALYGGAAGGGKSDALLMAAAQHVHRPHYRGILFRKRHVDLAKPGALIPRAMEWWVPQGARWNGTDKQFTFPSGAVVAMGYLDHVANDKLQYQGAAFHFAGWDELTHWGTDEGYKYVGLSRVRREAGDQDLPLRCLAASNPGGAGHTWVKRRFLGGVDPDTGVYAPPLHPYFPASIADNHHLDQEQYAEGLRDLHPTLRDQLLRGDWEAREPGDYFRAAWFGPLLDPETDRWPDADCIRIRWWDLAASEKEHAAFTSGVRMARHVYGSRAIEHVRSFRMTPGARDDAITQTAQADGYGVTVGLEIEPGSGGPAQFEALSKRLRSMGYRVVGARPRVGGAELGRADKAYLSVGASSEKGKAGRADPVASCLERGYQRRGEGDDNGSPWWGQDRDVPVYQHRDGIRLFQGPWTQAYLDVVEGFPDGATCDEVDATSGAWAWLEAHPAGASRPPRSIERQPTAGDDLDKHPDDRVEPPKPSIRKRGRVFMRPL